MHKYFVYFTLFLLIGAGLLVSGYATDISTNLQKTDTANDSGDAELISAAVTGWVVFTIALVVMLWTLYHHKTEKPSHHHMTTIMMIVLSLALIAQGGLLVGSLDKMKASNDWTYNSRFETSMQRSFIIDFSVGGGAIVLAILIWFLNRHNVHKHQRTSEHTSEIVGAPNNEESKYYAHESDRQSALYPRKTQMQQQYNQNPYIQHQYAKIQNPYIPNQYAEIQNPYVPNQNQHIQNQYAEIKNPYVQSQPVQEDRQFQSQPVQEDRQISSQPARNEADEVNAAMRAQDLRTQRAVSQNRY